MIPSLEFWAQAFYCIQKTLKKKGKKTWKKYSQMQLKVQKGGKISTNICFSNKLNAQNIKIEIMTKQENHGKWHGVIADQKSSLRCIDRRCIG